MDGVAEGQVCRAYAIKGSQGKPQKKAALITVQHTGSTFFCKLLEKHYGPYGNLKTEGCDFYYDHCYPHKRALIEKRLKGHLLITTIRNWDNCRASWIRRGNHDIEDFEAQLEAWREWIYPRADLVLSIDHMRRSRLVVAEERLGVDLETDWRPVNASADAGLRAGRTPR